MQEKSQRTGKGAAYEKRETEQEVHQETAVTTKRHHRCRRSRARDR